jgi:hypothetical protein
VGRRPEIPLDPPRGLVNEARPARLLPDRGGHRVQERGPLRGSIGRESSSSKVISSSEKCSGMGDAPGWGRATMRRLRAATSRGDKRVPAGNSCREAPNRNSPATTAFGVLARRPGEVPRAGVGMSPTKARRGGRSRSYRENTAPAISPILDRKRLGPDGLPHGVAGGTRA